MEPNRHEEVPRTRRGLEKPRITLYTKKNLCRIINAIIFILCFAGFSYQASEFVKQFYKYPSVIDIQVEQPPEYQLPAYTFCNLNRVKRSKYCAKYPDRCEHPLNMEEFCDTYQHYCSEDNMTDFMIPKHENASEGISLSEIQEIGHDVADFFPYDSDDADGPFYFNLKADFDFPCYTINARFESSKDPATDTYSVSNEGVYSYTHWGSYILDVEKDEVLESTEEPGALMAIHSPFEAVEPLLKSIFLRPGKTYIITVSVEEKHLLPHPYLTDCIDYIELWKKNYKSGPRSQLMCISRCQVLFDIACHGCATETSIYSNLSSYCTKEQSMSTKCYDLDEQEDNMTNCKLMCKKECLKVSYHYTFEEMNLMNVYGIDMEPDEIEIQVYTDGAGIAVMTHKPQYKTVEFFSYIGGFIGMWLGISIWALTGYIRHMFSYLKARLRRRSMYKLKSNVSIC